jgi:hypothetical protein
VKVRHLSVVLVVLLGIFASAALLARGSQFGLGSPPDPTPYPIGEQPYPDAYKSGPGEPAALPVPGRSPNHLTHPCGGMLAEPIFSGVSPLSIAYVPSLCPGTNTNPYGDIAVWQANGHDYVVQAGFTMRMYHMWNVDDPYNPVLLRSQTFPAGGTAATAIFDFKQTFNDITHYYMAVAMRGSGTGCGYFIYNVDDPANPVLRVRKAGTDWCTVHETFVSTDTNGSADYAWLTMSAESGSGYKIVALTLPDLSQPGTPTVNETGRYQRPDSNFNDTFIHDSNVVGNRVYVGHWQGGMLIFDKQTLATTIQPAPLNDINSIRPSPFWVHHTVPTTDGKFAFIEDEFINTSNAEKIKVYDITNINSPVQVGGIIGEGAAATSQAHNMVIQPISPGLDRLYVGWYRAGMRMYEVNTSGATPIITQTGMHQLRQTTGAGFGGVWGVDFLPCTLKGQPHTCIYSSDYEKFGLFVDAVGYDDNLDPYTPEAAITSPINGQQITGCNSTIQGTGHDYYSGLSQVEVSTDGGSTWQPAQGTLNWTYQWTIPGDGQYNIKVRATDLAGNTYVPTSPVTVDVTSCSVITATPQPSATNSPVLPTSTPVQPSATSVIPTSTAIVPSSTPVPATNTATAVPYTPIPDPTPIFTAQPTATSTPEAIVFVDVPPGHVFYEFVQCLASRGVMSGYADGTFRPDNTITRGQLAKMASNAAGYDDNIPSNRQSFEDVPSSNAFWLWIERLLLHGPQGGIITGYECGGAGEPCGPGSLPYFRPFADVTRGQIAKIVSNAAGFGDTPGEQTFADVDSTHPFYLWIERLSMHDVMGGYECGGPGEPCDGENRPYFRAFNNATRGQVAKIVANSFFPNCQTPARP